MSLVIQAAGHQRLVGIALEEGHQHFHAGPRDSNGAVAITVPANDLLTAF